VTAKERVSCERVSERPLKKTTLQAFLKEKLESFWKKFIAGNRKI